MHVRLDEIESVAVMPALIPFATFQRLGHPGHGVDMLHIYLAVKGFELLIAVQGVTTIGIEFRPKSPQTVQIVTRMGLF